MFKKCLIFDLDGTLLESLQGILDAASLSLKEVGIEKTFSKEEGKHFIGAGSKEFLRRALSKISISDNDRAIVEETFLDNYSKTQKVLSKPYDGIIEMLKTLANLGYFLCIVSNKPHKMLVEIVEEKYKEIPFAKAYGQIQNLPKKPDPYIINTILRDLNLNKEDCIYIGDSEFDVVTAENAGLESIIVTYGYGFYEEDWVKRATYKVDSVLELEKMLLN